ncbi:MAG: alpha-amylase/4-alpha-glucanotransferase domain-containing protein [Chloroflexota bacterium]
MKQLNLCLAFHNHQPVGNFPWVFADAYLHSYLPMLECLERHPAIRVSLHYTGPLLDWIRENRPEFPRRLATLVARDQVELMTGGYDEPILPSIPEIDRRGQIEKLTRVLRDEFGATATGLWLAERVWEPQLATSLKEANVDWTIVDDTHFKMSGLNDDQLNGYFLTEDQGNTLKVFATSKRLRYVIPWSSVEDVLAALTDLASDDPSNVAVMGDDGEKFGVWPGTYDYCWTQGWMDQFFAALEQNSGWLRIRPVGEYAREQVARGRIYLPTASYAEMMEWALPAAASEEFNRVSHEMAAAHRDDVTRFLRGGFWRNFLVKYDEANTMHKKMLRVHRKVHATRASDGQADAIALDELWQGQCNCPYWHGVFGGVYMTDVRAAIFHHLIRAEARAHQLAHGQDPWIAHETLDFDCDSRDEILVDSGQASYYLAPESGGTLFEWDLAGPAHNLISTMTRRPEAYHATLRHAAEVADEPDDSGQTKTIHDLVRLKEKGLEKRLDYDWYRRACLIDHFLRPGTDRAAFASARYGEDGDFVGASYQASAEQSGSRVAVHLTRDGHVWNGPDFLAVTVAKDVRVSADDPGFVAAYRVENRSSQALATTFGVELNLNLLGGGGNEAAFCRLVGRENVERRFDADAEAEDVSQVVAGNRYLAIETTIELAQPATAWWSPIDSISSSEGGFERVHQGSSLLLSWLLQLAAGQAWETTLRVGAGS